MWTFSLFCDLLYLGGAEPGLWSPLALYTMVGGFAAALAAALPGFVELVWLALGHAKKLDLTRVTINQLVIILYAANLWLRFSDPANMGVPIVLSAIGLGILAVSSWLGGGLVPVQGIATQPDAGPPADKE